MRGVLEPWHIIIIVALLFVLFGAKRMPDASRSLARSLKIFKSEVKDLHSDDDAETPQVVAAPGAPTATTPTTPTTTVPAPTTTTPYPVSATVAAPTTAAPAGATVAAAAPAGVPSTSADAELRAAELRVHELRARTERERDRV